MRRHRILVLDDDQRFRSSIKRWLSSRGYGCQTAATSEEAIALLVAGRFDVILADLHLGPSSRLPFFPTAQRVAPHVPVVVITGEENVARLHGIIGSGRIDAVLPKPVAPEELLKTIERLITLRSAEFTERKALAHALVQALSLKDVETEEHSLRVAAWSVTLASAMKLDEIMVEDIYLGALLHDIGKIGVPDAILRYPGKLSEEQWQVVRQHSQYGFDLLRGLPILASSSQIVLHHHERWDGAGYPDNLQGEQIPMGARLFAIADTYDAMTSDRPYRAALTHGIAAEEIEKYSGSQFDPNIVALFHSIDAAQWKDVRNDNPGPAAEASPPQPDSRAA